MSHWLEVRDGIHGFLQFTETERKIIDSPPVQRLRSIHQLAMTYLVYPGATHRRFEHSLGVMHVAGQLFEEVVAREKRTRLVPDALADIDDPAAHSYHRAVVRVAALCHDIGHLPFSHAAEAELFPDGENHETVTRRLLEQEPLAGLLASYMPALRIDDVVYAALGAKDAGFPPPTPWIALLGELITHPVFGADRIDYLLRDSHHAGVAYGRFDYRRLLGTIRALPDPAGGDPTLGVEDGGMHAALALLLARYQMFAQVYYHNTRRAFDRHLIEFLQQTLPEGRMPTAPEDFLAFTDDEVMAGIRDAARRVGAAGHEVARRIMERRHYRLVFEGGPDDIAAGSVEPGKVMYDALVARFGSEGLYYDRLPPRSAVEDFPVLLRGADRRVVSAISRLPALGAIPAATIEYVFAVPELKAAAADFVLAQRSVLLGASLSGGA